MLSRRHIVPALGLTAAAAALAAPALAQAPAAESAFDRIRRTKKLRIGAVAGAAPNYVKDIATGQWRGIYVDLCKSLAEELEAELEITETTFGNSILDLQSNKIDVFFGLQATPKRALAIDFSVPIFNNSYTFITRKDFAPKTWAEMNDPGVRIAVDAGSSQDQIVTRLAPKAQIVRLKSQDDATAALQARRADAQCLVFILAVTVLKKNAALGQLMVPTPIFSATSTVGFRREPDKTWRDYVNAWIEFNRGLGFIRETIVRNMELVGVSEADFPPGVAL